jgi:replicative DNA helicase
MARAKFDIANEQAVIRAAMADLVTRRKVFGAVTADDFIGSIHRALFKALLACGDGEIDTARIMLKAGSSDAGGREYIEDVFDLEVPADVDEHLFALRRDSARAHARTRADELVKVLADKTLPYEACEKAAVAVISRLRAPVVERSSGAALSGEYIDTLKARWSGDVTFRSVGYDILEPVLFEGFGPGVFCVIAGRTGNGKSSFAVDMVHRLLAGENKPRILVLPLEVGAIRFMDLLVARATGIDIELLVKRPGDLEIKQRKYVQRIVKKLVGTDDRLVVMDNPFYELGGSHSNDDAMDMTERLVAAGRYDIVLTDLWDRKLTDDRPQAVSACLKREQQMTKRYGFCSIAVHQMRRDLEKEKDKRPKLHYLKGTGAWEECGDLVFGVHREKEYKPHMMRDIIEIEILKQKGGDSGFVMEADFEPWIQRLGNPRLKDADEDQQPAYPAGNSGPNEDIY